MASCVFNTLLPIYMVSELKMSMRSMGAFEGVMEAFGYLVRMFSGVLSDMASSRKGAIGLGFAMGALGKFAMALSGSVGQLFVAKAVDRLGNGIQAAPRDALIGDLSPPPSRSACFGLAQSFRKWGSMTGAILVFCLMRASNNNYRLTFLAAAAASALSTLAFIAFVPSHPSAPKQQQGAAAAATATSTTTLPAAVATPTKPQQAAAAVEQGNGSSLLQRATATASRMASDVRSMGPDFFRLLLVITSYSMGHINESLLEARAIEVGFGKAESTLVVAALSAVVFVAAYQMGRLDDRRGPQMTLSVGMGSLIAGNLVLLASGAWPPAVFLACAFWGVHISVLQGPLLSVVAGLAPSHLKGTAFGVFYTVMALVAMASNSLYGALWHALGAPAAFGASATVATAALLALPFLLPDSLKRPKHQQALGQQVAQPQSSGSVAPGGVPPPLSPPISPVPSAA